MSITRNEILEIKGLRNRKERESSGLFVVEGLKSVIELWKSEVDIQRLFATAKGTESLPAEMRTLATIVDTNAMSRISSLKTPPGILAVAKTPMMTEDQWIAEVSKKDSSLVVVADELSDPGNVGALVRIADWFGCQGVALTLGSADPFNAKSVQASMGSVFRVPLLVASAETLVARLPFDWAVLDAAGNSLDDFNPPSRLALVVGSESHGPVSNWKNTEVLGIPGGQSPDRPAAAESLNASIAGAIAVAEITRKRRQLGLMPSAH